jgi:hypothetical protein
MRFTTRSYGSEATGLPTEEKLIIDHLQVHGVNAKAECLDTEALPPVKHTGADVTLTAYPLVGIMRLGHALI